MTTLKICRQRTCRMCNSVTLSLFVTVIAYGIITVKCQSFICQSLLLIGVKLQEKSRKNLTSWEYLFSEINPLYFCNMQVLHSYLDGLESLSHPLFNEAYRLFIESKWGHGMERCPSCEGNPAAQGEGSIRRWDHQHDRTDHSDQTGWE